MTKITISKTRIIREKAQKTPLYKTNVLFL